MFQCSARSLHTASLRPKNPISLGQLEKDQRTDEHLLRCPLTSKATNTIQLPQLHASNQFCCIRRCLTTNQDIREIRRFERGLLASQSQTSPLELPQRDSDILQANLSIVRPHGPVSPSHQAYSSYISNRSRVVRIRSDVLLPLSSNTTRLLARNPNSSQQVMAISRGLRITLMRLPRRWIR
jgi:hypothetical protein